MAALFLKSKDTEKGGIVFKKSFKEKFYAGFNSSFSAMTNRYTGGLKFLIKHKWVSMGGLALVLAITIYLVGSTKSGFIPTEDQGFVAISVSTPSGTSLDGTTKVLKQAEAEVRALPSASAFSAS